MKTNIIINLQFPALHHWPDCNIDKVRYLKYAHRHIFHVKLKYSVTHADRDIEFISKKIEIQRYVHNYLENQYLGSKSCEMIAEELLGHERNGGCIYVSVLEDNENGAEVFIT